MGYFAMNDTDENYVNRVQLIAKYRYSKNEVPVCAYYDMIKVIQTKKFS